MNIIDLSLYRGCCAQWRPGTKIDYVGVKWLYTQTICRYLNSTMDKG